MQKTLTKMDEFQSAINSSGFKEALKSMLPAHITPEKFTSVALSAIQRNPGLLDLDRASLFIACTDCAKDGLMPDGREAAFIPSKGRVRYSPMVAGIMKKVRNSGEISTIDAQVVYELDEYDSWTDEKGQHFKHKKGRGNRGNPFLTYAYAITKDGGFYFEELDEEQMAAIEACCTSKTSSPWKGSFRGEMKRKSALHRLCKYRLPSSTDIIGVIHRDDDMYEFDNNKKETSKEEEKRNPDKTKEQKSNLEKVVEEKVQTKPEDECEKREPGVKDTEFKEYESKPENDKSVLGVISDIKIKSGESNGKKWTHYRGELGNIHYGTFSDSFFEIMKESFDNKSPLKIRYETVLVKDKEFRNILNVELYNGKNPKALSEEDIPIE